MQELSSDFKVQIKIMKVSNYKALLLLGAIFFTACNSKPRVIEPEVASAHVNDTSIPALEDNRFLVADAPSKEHEVVVEEVLNTEKYAYLRVTERESIISGLRLLNETLP